MDNVSDNGGGITAQVALINKVVETITQTTQETDFAEMSVDERAEQLMALLGENDVDIHAGKTAAKLIRPETSIAQSSLFTGAIHEPRNLLRVQKGDPISRPYRYARFFHQVERSAPHHR